jgi:hypothetical protein
MARRIGSKVSSVIVAALRITVLVTQYTYRHSGLLSASAGKGKRFSNGHRTALQQEACQPFFSLLAGKTQAKPRSIPDRLSGGGQALVPRAGLL